MKPTAAPLTLPAALRMTVTPQALPGPLLIARAAGREDLRLEKTEDPRGLRLTLRPEPAFLPDGKPAPPVELWSPEDSGVFTLCWQEARVALYHGDRLVDEDWPLSGPPAGSWEVEAAPGVVEVAFADPGAQAPASGATITGPLQYWTPPGHNTGVGDCMPFADEQGFHLYYLFDRREHRSKGGLGAHQWAHLRTRDLRSWEQLPMALPVTHRWEGSICTGSLIRHDGRVWAFYAVRMSDGSPARLTYATSADGEHFEKSGVYFSLTAPYEPVSARDPMVFAGADGRFHMLVTTSLARVPVYGGCLAHLVSDNLTDWTQLEPFIVPGFTDQPECADYFEWNGWYYLVFANFGIARYRYSRQPFGPWLRPSHDLLDAPEVRVPKTAAFGDRRLLCGFLTAYPTTYAGNLVMRELLQQPDGTLRLAWIPEVLPRLDSAADIPETTLTAPQGRAAQEVCRTSQDMRLILDLRAAAGTYRYGLTLTFGGAAAYDLVFEPAARVLTLIRPTDRWNQGDRRLELLGLEQDGGLTLDAFVVEDMLDLVLQGRALTARLTHSVAQGLQIEAWVQEGEIRVSRGSWQPVKHVKE